jgi:hypothetical protein
MRSPFSLSLCFGLLAIVVLGAPVCTYTQGYWKNHSNNWPVSSLKLGKVSYSETQLLQIFNLSPVGDGYISLAHQLIAAKLNLVRGAVATSDVSTAVSQADTLIGEINLLTSHTVLDPATSDPLTQLLDDFNSGLVPGAASHCGGSVKGDPVFVGLRGQVYQVHGVSGNVYNIISDPDLQYNSRFVYLSRGDCPRMPEYNLTNCWSHPGSYLGELGLKTRSGARIHIVSGGAQQGFASVTLDGKVLHVNDSVGFESGYITFNHTHAVMLTIGNWVFRFENSDMFINQQLRLQDPRYLQAHGLVGQTWRTNLYPNAIKYIQGTVDDYVVRGGNLFGDDFMFNAYN